MPNVGLYVALYRLPDLPEDCHVFIASQDFRATFPMPFCEGWANGLALRPGTYLMVCTRIGDNPDTWSWMATIPEVPPVEWKIACL